MMQSVSSFALVEIFQNLEYQKKKQVLVNKIILQKVIRNLNHNWSFRFGFMSAFSA